MAPAPRGQSIPFESGWSGLPMILVTRPSFTWASTPQFQKQSSQKLATTFSPSVPGSLIGLPSSPHQPVVRPEPTAATPAEAAPIWMNFLREMGSMAFPVVPEACHGPTLQVQSNFNVID